MQPSLLLRYTFLLGLYINCQLNPVQAQPTAMHNKQLVQTAFDKWADKTGNFFDLLADDLQWTITGSTPFSKTYTSKKQFLDYEANCHPWRVRSAKAKGTNTNQGSYI